MISLVLNFLIGRFKLSRLKDYYNFRNPVMYSDMNPPLPHIFRESLRNSISVFKGFSHQARVQWAQKRSLLLGLLTNEK